MTIDFFDPNTWEPRPPCRIYDRDMERFALVDEKYFYDLVTQRDTNPHRTGKLMSRRWNIKPAHKKRNGKKLYFVSSAGWRQGRAVFLHVLVMRMTGKLPPSNKHKLVNHIDGDEWNCQEENLEWATHVRNRRTSKQKYSPGKPL
jgi:hypothetical protein